MLDSTLFTKGLTILQSVGLEEKDQWEMKIWLKILNDPNNNLTVDEFQEACMHLARTRTSFYPGDNIPAMVLDRVKDHREEKKRQLFKEKEEREALEEREYRRKFLEEHKENALDKNMEIKNDIRKLIGRSV
tara:strand:- start:412 stop:807 length:396 start_codon:yes stop_codon:yes gene_type:complete